MSAREREREKGKYLTVRMILAMINGNEGGRRVCVCEGGRPRRLTVRQTALREGMYDQYIDIHIYIYIFLRMIYRRIKISLLFPPLLLPPPSSSSQIFGMIFVFTFFFGLNL